MIHSLFADLTVKVNTVICLGDTNIVLMSSNDVKYLRRILQDKNMIQLIKERTRVTMNSTTLLDHTIVDSRPEREERRNDAANMRDHRFMSITDEYKCVCLEKKN